MPARNVASWIETAVGSTLKALAPDDELLVFDDGSTDNTGAILDSFRDSRLIVLRSEKSLGIASALNHLISRSGGDFIARMDADDICLPWRFKIQLKALRKSGSDLVFSTPILLFQTKVLSLPIHFPFARVSESNFENFGHLHNFGFHPTAFGKSEVFKSLCYRELPDEDHDLWKRAMDKGYKLRRFYLPTVMLRQHPGQITKSSEWKRMMRIKSEQLRLPSMKGLPLLLRLEVIGPRRMIRSLFGAYRK